MREKLNGFHVTLLVYMTQSGIALFYLPRFLAENLGTNGWIVLFLLNAIVSFHICLIALVYRRGQARSPMEILEQFIPKAFLTPFYLGWAGLMTMLGCLVCKQYLILYHMTSFPTTNPGFFQFVCHLLIFSLLLKGIYNISKTATIFFYISFWVSFTSILLLDEFSLVRLTPFLFQGAEPHFLGWINIYTCFLGYELSLFLPPYVSGQTRFFRAVFLGNLIATFESLVVSLLCFGIFGFEPLKKTLFPLMDLISYLELPFVERIDTLMLAVFLYKILITSAMYVWVSLEMLKRVFPRTKYHWLCLFVLGGAFLLSNITQVLREVEIWLQILSFAQTFVSVAFTLLLLFLLRLEKKYRKEETPHA